MNASVGRKYSIAGMELEILSDADDKWETRNITTREIVMMDKQVLENAIKLGKADEIEEKTGGNS